MATTISYSILFEVKILHHYFLNRDEQNFAKMTADQQVEMLRNYDVRELFEIVPSSECLRDLGRHRCLFKPTATGIIVGLKAMLENQATRQYKPSLDLADDLRFTFHLHTKDFGLLNYTALPLTGNSGQVYLFTNDSGLSAKDFPSLCSYPGSFLPGRGYLPGEMVVDHANQPTKLHIAKLKTTVDPDFSPDWLTEDGGGGLPLAYANARDRYPLVRQQFNYRVTVAGVEPTVTIRTADGIGVAVKSALLPGEFRTIQLDLRGLPEGFYRLHAATPDQSYQDDWGFYLLQQQDPPFAIVQLAVKSDTAAYAMLDPQGCLQSPTYALRFRNRATHWRYIGKKFNASSITDEPLPLTRFGFIDEVTVPDKNGYPVTHLANPERTMIKAEALTVEAEKRFYSEIHVH